MQQAHEATSHTSSVFHKALASYRTNTGATLEQVCAEGRTLVVFLRHGGCIFCREALDELSRTRNSIEHMKTRLVLVHMMSDDEARELFSRYALDDVFRISDPDRSLYEAFGLEQGSVPQLLGWKVWWRGLVAGVLHRHPAGRLKGDGRQMPGVFLLKDGEIIHEFRHRTPADRPGYADMVSCAITGGDAARPDEGS